MKTGAVLLAAGKSSRFGKNKLTAGFGKRPMVCCAMDVLSVLAPDRAAVVTGCSEISRLAAEYDFEIVENKNPERGQAHSICLGVKALQEMDAILLMVCDQPLLTAASIRKLMDAFALSGKGMACLKDASHMGNPAVFSRRYYPELLALTGDRGAKGILKTHPDDLLIVECEGENELSDCDTAEELERLQRESVR